MTGKKEYVKLWLSYETYFQSYTPTEIGNLTLAMLRYKDTGEEPVFQGNERFIWPAVRRDINEACDAQEAAADRARENGKKGGRPRKAAPESPPEENPPGSPEPRKTARAKGAEKAPRQGQGHTGEKKRYTGFSSPEEARKEAERMNRFLLQLRREREEITAAEEAG